MTYALALQALADPTRRDIFDRLRKRPASVTAIAEAMPVSRPAVSQHLKVLREAGLVSEHAEGTQRIYRADPEGLRELRAYLDEAWDDALAAFKAEAKRMARRRGT
ncbi:MAG: winged helix-turn-helix transcriptional regulator [Alphaproteobacteria bacterium]|nr:winged helix-turn-helix transcriptional regulator [Alphaproteobacteria bacterium]